MGASLVADVPELASIIIGYLFDDSIFAVPQQDLLSCMQVSPLWFKEGARVLWWQCTPYLNYGLIHGSRFNIQNALQTAGDKLGFYAGLLGHVVLRGELLQNKNSFLKDALDRISSSTLLLNPAESSRFTDPSTGQHELVKDWNFQNIGLEFPLDETARNMVQKFQEVFSDKNRQYKLHFPVDDPETDLLSTLEGITSALKSPDDERVVEIEGAAPWDLELSPEDRTGQFGSVVNILFRAISDTVRVIDIHKWDEKYVVAFATHHCRRDMQIFYPELEELRLGVIPLGYLPPLYSMLERCAPKLKVLQWSSPQLWDLQRPMNFASLKTFVFHQQPDLTGESPLHLKVLPALLKNCTQLETIKLCMERNDENPAVGGTEIKTPNDELIKMVSGLSRLKFLEIELPNVCASFGKEVYEALADKCRELEFFRFTRGSVSQRVDYTTLASTRVPMFPNLRGCTPECDDQHFTALHMPNYIGTERLFYSLGNFSVMGLAQIPIEVEV